MNDKTPNVDQKHKLQVLLSKLKDLKAIIWRPFQVGAIITKLPSSWYGYQKLLNSIDDYNFEQINDALRSNIHDVENKGSSKGKKWNHAEANSKKDKAYLDCGKKRHFNQEYQLQKEGMKQDTS